MAEPTILPPVPILTQPSHPGDDSPGLEQVQRAFDRAYPDRTPTRAVEPPPASPAPQAPQAPQAPTTETPPPETPPPPPPEPTKPVEEHKIPSFLEEALKLEPRAEPKPPAPEPESEWAEDIAPEERKSRIKGLRDAYKNLKKEVETLRERPNRDPLETQKLAYLEGQNRQMSEMLSRVGVEHSAEFQQQILVPLTAHWNEAARIVRDAGADPNDLAKAMTLSGRSQFEALDTLFSDLPESARAQAHDALRSYRRFEDARRNAVANAPQTLEHLHKREVERQYQEVSKQRDDMKGMFERALSRLRDEAKVEVFQHTQEPDGKWWNDQADQMVEAGRNLFLENTDLDKVAFACLLAPAADAYRKLFIQSQKKISELQQIIKDKIGNEPVLSESSGNAGNQLPEQQLKEDLKRPFADVFLREFHKAQGRNR
jgi:hypothetical protein